MSDDAARPGQTMMECTFCMQPWPVPLTVTPGIVPGFTCLCGEPLTLRRRHPVTDRPAITTTERQREINARGMAKVRAAVAAAQAGQQWDGYYTYAGRREWISPVDPTE